MADTDKKVYLPKQHVKRGVAGYRGENIVVVDAKGKTAEAPTKRKAKKPAED